ncbi:hypothetical protein N7520_003556 [Penicillium odoratum]|uniref:uncharacterized protein n=1 Tax=Penicillium odoratum TaxID=1167516 RepID=UPI002548FD3E|nr:uncharacterized protein N7520_003556 [Penicillium odoratum]KAJ5768997.1 hypothetical protein N7520_003556 [Penicillium odoratum]
MAPGDPVQALRYIQVQLKLYTLILLFFIQHASSFEVPKANSMVDRCSEIAPTGRGNRRGRQSSESSTSSSDPLENLVNPETLANGGGELMTPAIARELDKKKKKDDEDDKGSLQIKIHLDLHAKIRLDLDADLYGDIVIGLL